MCAFRSNSIPQDSQQEALMVLTVTSHDLEQVVRANLAEDTFGWLCVKREAIISMSSGRDLFMTYSMMSSKIPHDETLILTLQESPLNSYIVSQQARALDLARVYLLMCVLEEDPEFFTPKVAKIIEVADKNELETFLKFLVFLPNHEAFAHVAVEALRTNIASVFDAIALNNPYPSLYFNDQQWNQMYLKAAFMQRDLSRIVDVDKRANADLARIISDYAHERWAASRDVDPMFWRPVAGFMNETLQEDMKRLLNSSDRYEQWAGGLSCFHSNDETTRLLLEPFPELKHKIESGEISWNSIKKIL